MSERLTDQIRASKPTASPELRERIRELAAQQPEPRRSVLSQLLPRRRFLLVAAPAAAAVAIVSAGVIGFTRSDDAAPGGGGVTATAEQLQGAEGAPTTMMDSSRAAAPPTAKSGATTLPAPDPGRLERYDAQLRLRVGTTEELSRATVRAMQIARSLGGYVASVTYATPERGLGTADLVLRVPTSRVQAAVLRFSQLGTILSQQVQIEDLQGQVDDLSDRIVELQSLVARLERQLNARNLTADERLVLQQQLSEARRELRDLRSSKAQTTREGRLATFSLSLTTAQAAAAQDDSRLDRALDEAKDILALEVAVVLYALVIVGPFALLGLLVWLALRLRRRREEARLLAT
jgi:hypothetical protein